METLLLLLHIPAIVFVVLLIYAIGRAVRFGENRPQLTNAASELSRDLFRLQLRLLN